MSESSNIGVVAIGRDEGERLRRCLRSIPSGMPIVYVDSASVDDSVAFARSVGAQVVELDMSRPFTAARARNEGAAALMRAEPGITMIQFVDGDCEIESDWFRAARTFLVEHSDVAVVCGRRRERFPQASLYNRLADQEWDTPIGEATACGGDALYRRAAFDAIAGFDAAMIAGEEPELCGRLRAEGWRIWRLDAPMTVHDAAMDQFRQWWLRAVRGGFGYAQVWNRSRRNLHPLYGRELLRAFFWTLGVAAIAISAAMIIGPLGLLMAPLIWLVQWVRLSAREGARKAGLLLVGKLAETIGALRFAAAHIRGQRSGAIFYK